MCEAPPSPSASPPAGEAPASPSAAPTLEAPASPSAAPTSSAAQPISPTLPRPPQAPATAGSPRRRSLGWHAALDLSEEDGGEGGLLGDGAAAARGAERKRPDGTALAVAQLRRQIPVVRQPKQEDDRITLSERAERETRFIKVLPNREVSLDEDGKASFEGAPVAAEARYHAVVEGELGELAERQEVWSSWRQVREDLELVRSELIKRGVNLDAPADHLSNHQAYERPPTPDWLARRRWGEEEGLEEEKGVDAHTQYRRICLALGLPPSPTACEALHVIDKGTAALPQALSGRAYLGNRGAQALFLALAASGADDERPDRDGVGGALAELRSLDFSGQGVGNEAAAALAALLPFCRNLGELTLSRNHISESGAKALFRAIEAHPALHTVSLDTNPVSSRIRVRLRQLLAARQETVDTRTGANRYVR